MKIFRSACGDVMDNYKGDNYEIIVDDAFKYLAKYAEEKKTFDVIFGDLTDIPIHTGGSTWNFVKAVIKSSLRLLPVGEFIVYLFIYLFNICTMTSSQNLEIPLNI